jgi:competence protein ComEA
VNTPQSQSRDARRFAGVILAPLALSAVAAASLRPIDASPPNLALRIDLNTADAAELTLLPDIGPARARAIIADREAHGPFHTLADLDRVPDIGPRTIDGLAAHAAATSASKPDSRLTRPD